MNRKDLQVLTRIRLKEAQTLFKAECYDGAYYLAGYSVECALKACIAKKTRRSEFPDKKTVLDSYSHKLGELLNVAGLKNALDQESQSNASFDNNWVTVKDWTEESRYQRNSKAQAGDLLRAITARNHGVLRWIRLHW